MPTHDPFSLPLEPEARRGGGGFARPHRDTIHEPINLGSSELVTINTLVDVAEQIAGVKLKRRYNLGAPGGVAGRNRDNTLLQQRPGWEPSISLRTGLEKTYRWTFGQIAKSAA